MNKQDIKRINTLINILEILDKEKAELEAIGKAIINTDDNITISLEMPYIPDDYDFDFDDDDIIQSVNPLASLFGIGINFNKPIPKPTITKHLPPKITLLIIGVLLAKIDQKMVKITKKLTQLNVKL